MITSIDRVWRDLVLDGIGYGQQQQETNCPEPSKLAVSAIIGVLIACSAVGLAINFLLIAALARGAFRATPTALLLTWLAIIDSASLLTVCLPLATTELATSAANSARQLHLCRALPYLQLSVHSCQAAAHCLLVAERLLGHFRRHQRGFLLASAIIAAALLILHLPMLPDTGLVSLTIERDNVNSSQVATNRSLECLLKPDASAYSWLGLPWLAFVLQLALPALLAVLLLSKLAIRSAVQSCASRSSSVGRFHSNESVSNNENRADTTAEMWSDQLALTAIMMYALFHMPSTGLRFVLFLSGHLPQVSQQLQLQQASITICAVGMATNLACILRPCFQPLVYLAACPVFRRDFGNSLFSCGGKGHLQPKDSVMVMRSRLDVK